VLGSIRTGFRVRLARRLLFFLALIAVIPDEIAVRVSVERCRLETLIPDALSRALPGVAITRAGAASRSSARFVLSIEDAGRGRVSIRLADERGAPALERALPVAEDACTAAADGVALIVERHLRDLGWTAPEPELPVLERPRTATVATATAAPEVAPPPKLPPPPPDPIEAPPPALPLELAIGLRALGGIEVSSFGGEARAKLSLAPAELTISAGATLPAREDIERDDRTRPIGQVRVSSLHALAGIGLCFPIAFLRGCASAEGGVERFSARSEGDVFPNTAGTATRPLAAADVRAEWTIVPRVAVFASAGLRVRPIEVAFEVRGAAEPYVPPRARAAFGLGVWVSLF
jgi:hypothetical protein